MPAKLTQVPDSWWRVTCAAIHHPIACVDATHYFVWANNAYEKLTGYSLSELRQKTWIDLTVQADVGGDMASIKSVIDGDTDFYTLAKRYVHKFGHVVPVNIAVWRFPRSGETLLCFIVEALPEIASDEQIDALEKELRGTVTALERRLAIMERDEKNNNAGSSHVNFSMGNNSVEVLKWLIWPIIALLATISYLIYIAGWPGHHGDAAPPANSIPNIESQ